MSLRVVIVDDEEMARQRLKRFLSGVRDVELLAECHDGPAAIAAIREHKPDVVFLDVQMPKMDGFEVLRQIEEMPVVVFVTAFDRFALKAFEAQALDYLLKPFDEERVQRALDRVRTFLEGDSKRSLQDRLTALLHATAVTQPSACLFVKNGERVIVLRPREIDWVEADGDYVHLHVGQESHLLRSRLTDVEQRLKAGGFVRIHRSRLVNLERVKEFRALFRGECVAVLKNGTRLNVSHACWKQLQDQFEELHPKH